MLKTTSFRSATRNSRHLTYGYLIVCCALIAAISVHDAMLVVLNHESILEEERNPIGWWLLAIRGGDVWLFVFVKLLGTSVVCSTLLTLFRRRPQMAIGAASFLASLQLVLLTYLCFW